MDETTDKPQQRDKDSPAGANSANKSTTGPVKTQVGPRRSNPSDLLKNLKSVDKKHQKKPTILELAAQDWNKRKAEEKIEEELKQATKSKTGYLERQRFLERSDLRQFEREREIRDKVRSRASLNKDSN